MIEGSEDGSLVLEEQIDPNYVPTKEGNHIKY